MLMLTHSSCMGKGNINERENEQNITQNFTGKGPCAKHMQFTRNHCQNAFAPNLVGEWCQVTLLPPVSRT